MGTKCPFFFLSLFGLWCLEAKIIEWDRERGEWRTEREREGGGERKKDRERENEKEREEVRQREREIIYLFNF